MPASYPAGFDTMSDPSANLSGPPLHSTMHNQINDVIEAIEAELGINPSGADATVAATLAALPSRYAAVEPAWTNWTVANGFATEGVAAVVPGATGNWGTATVDAKVLLNGKRCRASLWIKAGAGAGATAGSMTLNLPVACRIPAVATSGHIGSGFYINVGVGIFCQFDIIIAATGTANLYYAATHLGALTAISQAAPFAFAVGNQLAITLDYERA